jgi:hypothetical protein
MSRKISIEPYIGKRFGKLTVVKEVGISNGRRRILTICDCGNEKVTAFDTLRDGRITNCGCRKGSGAIYKSLSLANVRFGMLHRCYNPRNSGWRNYGARGIKVCDEWRASYDAFYDWALASGYRDGLTIERIDNDGNYEPSNCRWIPFSEQGLNKRNSLRFTAFGETKTVAEWSRDPRCIVKYHTLYHRIVVGVQPEIALTTPTYNYTLLKGS